MAKRVFRKILKGLGIFVLIVCILAALLVGAWAAFYFHHSDPADVRQYETTNPHIASRTMISAHRSGAGIVPEELLAAFKYCIETSDFEIDYFEFDLRLTKDGELVLLHDATLDRTSNSEAVFGETNVNVGDKTLAELRRLNMGAKFVDEDGNMPYADLTEEEVTDDLRIATLDEVLDYLCSQGDFGYIIEIKDSGERGKQAADLLYEKLKAHDLLDSALICSFRDEVLQYVEQQYPDASRGASKSETVEFILAALLGKKDFDPPYAALQLPYGDMRESYGVNTGLAKVINYAHERNIAVFYWTINDPEDMAYLSSIGADLIMSDYPNLLNETINK